MVEINNIVFGQRRRSPSLVAGWTRRSRSTGPRPTCTAEKERHPRQYQNLTAKWDLEPQRSYCRNQRNVKETNQKEGQRLAENKLGRADGRHHDLLESADLSLANDGEGRQRNHEHESKTADNSGHEKPATPEVGVI